MPVRIGTSGFSYASWKNVFYPERLAASKWLVYYATRFNTLELNNTFYRFPVLKNLKTQWNNTPDDFVFSVKAHKIITHTMRMKHAKSKVDEFMQIVQEGLGHKLGCVLFQLPPSFRYSEENIDHILESVPHGNRNVIEFRHISWWNREIWKTLHKHHLTFCHVSFPGLPDRPFFPDKVFYLRMHGVPELFRSSYDDETLTQLAARIPKDRNCYIYFNNTMFEAGFRNAEMLKSISGV